MGTCTVCLEPTQTHAGCGCRGGNGMVHLACLSKSARFLAPRRGVTVWGRCMLCTQSFSGTMLVEMARAWVAESRTFRSKRHLVESLLAEHRDAEAGAAAGALARDARRKYGATDVRTHVCNGLLAVWLAREGACARANALFVAAIRATERRFGASGPVTLQVTANYACCLMAQGRNAEAERMNRALLATMRVEFGDEHASTLGCVGNLSIALAAQSKYTEAGELCAENLRVQARVLGDAHADTQYTTMLIRVLSRYRYESAFPLEELERHRPQRPQRPTVRLELRRKRKWDTTVKS